MKKILILLVLALSMVGYAQEGSIRPKFQAFSGALLKLKDSEKGFLKFSLKVDVAPWAFQAIGEVRAPNGDPELLREALFEGEVYAVLAYIDNSPVEVNGEQYNVGLFDIMLYYDEEPTTIRNLKFRLLPPADDDWSKGILNDALASGSLLGQIWKGKYERAITKASADPIDKRKLQSMKKKKMEAEDSEMSVAEKRKQRMKDMADDDQPKKKKKKMSNRDECDDPNLSPREKKRCRMKKK
ncbi:MULTISPECIES: hypothetical protein [unclassified Fibrobacter]|jgi:hypothetical protein|uniref:hypothetical protein n=1 Tax=unclassified Fibrobacter TaxID=2634177 RepID=UPI00156752F7|nr:MULTISPECIES: hypothetical protein [unclassified Fibrobacter]